MKFKLSYTNPLAPSLGFVVLLVTFSRSWDAYWAARGLPDSPVSQIEDAVVTTGTITLSLLAGLAVFLSLNLISSLFSPEGAKAEKDVCS